jgi:hypothetical protein
VAVHIDVSAFRESLPDPVAAAADRLLREGGVGELESVGGGVRAVVRDGGTDFEPWVGVVERSVTGDCECAFPDDLCGHAVAVALTAFEAGVRFSAAGSPHGADPDDQGQADFVRAVQRLGPRQLTDLVVQHAGRDRLFAALLLGRAGMLDPADRSGLADFKAVLREASKTTAGTRWDFADVEIAGRRLVGEVEILCAWPATPEMLDLVEKAIEVWDKLSGYLWESDRDAAPEEIGEPLVDAHRELCERLNLEPAEIGQRVGRLVDRCEFGTVDASAYADLTG